MPMTLPTRHDRLIGYLTIAAAGASAAAIDGGARYIDPMNGWRAFEVITEGDDPAGDGYVWSMPEKFDGLGVQRVGAKALRVQVNHEISGGNATITELILDLDAILAAISNTLNTGSTGGVSFVESARQAYDRWSPDAGSSWVTTTDATNTGFSRFCSGQSYAPNTFGPGRGFVDDLYITGEESGKGGRLFALDIHSREFYQLSGVAGAAPGGLPGMPTDAWENAALLDTGETDHVALLLSPDGGTEDMKIYIGVKGLDRNGVPSSGLLARNGLEFGSYYYLNGSLPDGVGSTFAAGHFDTTSAGALNSSKLEDIDTSPSSPDRVVLGDQNSGVFVFDFDLSFAAGPFDPGASIFRVTKVAADGSGVTLGDADNVDWTAPTTLGGVEYPDGLLLINEDNSDGQVWIMEPDGSNPTWIGDTAANAGTESSGVLDISGPLGYLPASIVLSSNQGSPSSLTVLINPDATPASCGSADLAPPLGVLDFTDVIAFLNAFSETDGSADFAKPIGIFNFNDVIGFLGAFAAGCP